MKSIAHLTATTLLVCSFTQTVFAWGDEGHRTIGAMADKLIASTEAGKHVQELLGEETLSTASVWADKVKDRNHRNLTAEMLRFTYDNPKHNTFHYTDIPFEEKEYSDKSIGATNVDVVHAIPACILILQGKTNEQTVFVHVTPKIALRLLAHYIEDLHQPLHAGAGYLHDLKFGDPNGATEKYNDDQGGNLLLFGGTNKLHFYWDVTVVKDDMAKASVQTPTQYAEKLLSKPTPNYKDSGPLLDWDRKWAQESIALAAKVHDVTVVDEDDSQTDYKTGVPRPRWHIKDLTPDYMAWADKTAEDQMTIAGYRLAETLEAIWPDKPAQ